MRTLSAYGCPRVFDPSGHRVRRQGLVPGVWGVGGCLQQRGGQIIGARPCPRARRDARAAAGGSDSAPLRTSPRRHDRGPALSQQLGFAVQAVSLRVSISLPESPPGRERREVGLKVLFTASVKELIHSPL